MTTLQTIHPTDYMQYDLRMELAATQVQQQFAPITKAAAQLAQVGQTLSRAFVFIVEQYEKTPKAKQKKAHANLVRVVNDAMNRTRAGAIANLLRGFVQTLRTTPSDERAALRVLLSEQHLANAPNTAAQRFVRHDRIEVAATT